LNLFIVECSVNIIKAASGDKPTHLLHRTIFYKLIQNQQSFFTVTIWAWIVLYSKEDCEEEENWNVTESLKHHVLDVLDIVYSFNLSSMKLRFWNLGPWFIKKCPMFKHKLIVLMKKRLADALCHDIYHEGTFSK
jgi:hypothetical protein